MPSSAKEVTGRKAPRVRVSKSKLLCIEYRDFLEAIKIFLFHLGVNILTLMLPLPCEKVVSESRL